MTERIPGFATLAVHAGAQPDPTTGARATPIYQTTSYVFESVDHAASLFGLQTFGNIYTRIGNPTNAVLEEDVWRPSKGARRDSRGGVGTRSAGVGVLHCLLQPGDEFVASRNSTAAQSISSITPSRISAGTRYGRTSTISVSLSALFLAEDQGDFYRVDCQSGRGHHRHGRGGADRAPRSACPTSSTTLLATPYLCKPFEHGADIVVHSLTKFLGGHGNSIGGMIVDGGTFNWSRERRYPMLCEPRPEYHGIVLHETFGNFAFAIACRVLALRDIGPALSPFNAFLILTGIETLPLRMQKHCDNALAVAEWVSQHPKVAWVSYPGLPGDRYHNLAKKYLPERRRRGVHLRPQGWLRRRSQACVEREAVLASRQYRRHPLADHSPRLDHAPPAQRCAEGPGRRRPGRCAAVDRHRRQGRHHCRPRSRTGRRVRRGLGHAAISGAMVLRKKAKPSATLKAACALSVAPAWPPSGGS